MLQLQRQSQGQVQALRASKLVDRQWPNRVITSAPTWVSTDLRDGNQALATPMSVGEKLTLFKHLVACGFKEIEVGFPSASATEFWFLRTLIESGAIPEDVWIQVLVPTRKDLITRTFEALQGATHVIIQLYSSTADLFREVIYRYSKEDLIRLAVDHTRIVRHMADNATASYGSVVRLVYGLEGFSQSDPEYVIQVCTAIKDAWASAGPSPHKIVFNFAATVEVCGPNQFADQIEYFCKNMPGRDEVIVSVHTHNDRGTAVAATELSLLAGAERVDGCLFGNGERTGNVDLITLALNLYSQGIAPGLTFNRLSDSIDLITRFTKIPVHPRHPYTGELVYTAFAGMHQDGISKGLAAHREAELTGHCMHWNVPYLPVDPADFGLSYIPVRVNSQSGKGGLAFVIKQTLGLNIPRAMQSGFYSFIQNICETTGKELTPEEIASHFREFYHFRTTETDAPDHISLREFNGNDPNGEDPAAFKGTISVAGTPHIVASSAEPLRAMPEFISCQMKRSFVVAEQENGSSHYGFSTCVNVKDGQGSWWGVGVAKEPIESQLRAIISAVNCANDTVAL
ncbi:2-isopropylmalate synthase [Mycena leptocephala]|nr:2-isopropylmalate synthase [Mycena leptocephala]